MKKTVNRQSIMDKLESNDREDLNRNTFMHEGSEVTPEQVDSIDKATVRPNYLSEAAPYVPPVALKGEIRAKDIANLKARLKEYGYFVENLWHVDDVIDRAKEAGVKIGGTEAHKILKDVLHNEAQVSEFNEAIDNILDDRYPKYAKFRKQSKDEEQE